VVQLSTPSPYGRQHAIGQITVNNRMVIPTNSSSPQQGTQPNQSHLLFTSFLLDAIEQEEREEEE
jgi:hypothetical protein